MLRAAFDKELQELQAELLYLGSEVEANLTKAADVLITQNLNGARMLIKADEWINERRIDIGMAGLKLIATQQPMAGDMRLIAAMIEITGELERIHDYVKGIGKITLLIGTEPDIQAMTKPLIPMAQLTQQMLHEALDAFVRRNTELAQTIPNKDDAVDALYNEMAKAIMDYLHQHPDAFELGQRLEWAAHNLERAADRVINICEWILYVTTGKYTEINESLQLG
jgi:phosphate transport system protein